MTSIKISKETATLLGVISRGKNQTVEQLILDALNSAYKRDVESALEIMATKPKKGSGEGESK